MWHIIILYMKSYLYKFIHVTSFMHMTSFKNKYDFFEFIRSFISYLWIHIWILGYQGSRWTAHVTSPSRCKGYWTCTAIEMLTCLVLNIFKKSHCSAHVTSPHWPTQDSTHLIGWEWIISSSPRSAASHLRPTLLVETEPCPAWARVWVGWAGRLGHSNTTDSLVAAGIQRFLAYHRKINALQLQIPAINKIPANWANTSPTNFPTINWIMKQMVINAKHLL